MPKTCCRSSISTWFSPCGPSAQIAYWNKKAVYDLLLRVSAETLSTIAADTRHLGARIGTTSVLHTWGSALTHHPHVHIIVPGGGLSPDGRRWISCRPRVLPARAGSVGCCDLMFYGDLAGLAEIDAFAAWLAPVRKSEWVVYGKPPFGGPEAVLAYLSRYTHRVAISNSRLISADAEAVTFRWKDYRVKTADRQKVMRLATDEFIRRFLLHVLPDGSRRIRHYGLLASGGRKTNVAKIRALLGAETGKQDDPPGAEAIPLTLREPCPALLLLTSAPKSTTHAAAPCFPPRSHPASAASPSKVCQRGPPTPAADVKLRPASKNLQGCEATGQRLCCGKWRLS
ncbi:Mobile element protein (plasmid) [Sinorhizobium sp. CCBAU 05631]|nr:Mobile element protein [Sinorhizobium sp. CCBAU 05631]